MDDLKLSHLQQQELDNFIDHLNDIFGSEGKLRVALYGKIHEYLGMTIDWSVDEKVILAMYDYLEVILAQAPDDFDGEDVSPSVSDLFQLDEACKKLDTPRADMFHCFVARFLYVAKRARSDLQLSVSFLYKLSQSSKHRGLEEARKAGTICLCYNPSSSHPWIR